MDDFIVCSEKIINLGNLYFDSRCIHSIMHDSTGLFRTQLHCNITSEMSYGVRTGACSNKILQASITIDYFFETYSKQGFHPNSKTQPKWLWGFCWLSAPIFTILTILLNNFSDYKQVFRTYCRKHWNYFLKVHCPISQNGDIYSNDASSPKKTWFQISVNCSNH